MNNFEKNRDYFNQNIRPKLAGKVPRRIELLLARAYMFGDIAGPIEQIDDAKLDRLYGIGPGTLTEIRKVIKFQESK
jgi:hypothetical protein